MLENAVTYVADIYYILSSPNEWKLRYGFNTSIWTSPGYCFQRICVHFTSSDVRMPVNVKNNTENRSPSACTTSYVVSPHEQRVQPDVANTYIMFSILLIYCSSIIVISIFLFYNATQESRYCRLSRHSVIYMHLK